MLCIYMLTNSLQNVLVSSELVNLQVRPEELRRPRVLLQKGEHKNTPTDARNHFTEAKQILHKFNTPSAPYRL